MGQRAACWCIVGAANKASYDLSREIVGDSTDDDSLNDALNKAMVTEHQAVVMLCRLAGVFSKLLTPRECLTAWNGHEHRSHADGIALLDRAIEEGAA